MTSPANDNSALWAYRNRPDHPPEPLQSNWSTEPSGIVEIDEDDRKDGVELSFHPELSREVKPSIERILREMREERAMNDAGQVVSIGRLQFSDGTQHERAYRCGPDGKVKAYMCRMPVGAMLRTTERIGAPNDAGRSQAEAFIGNAQLTRMLLGDDAVPRLYITGAAARRRGKSYTARQSRELLAQAIANTPTMPAVTKLPPGVATGTERSSDCFFGMKVAPKGKGGAINWTDLYMARRDHDDWLATVADLDAGSQAVLEASLTARNYTDIGEAAGQSKEYARRKGGKRALAAANDNLGAEMRKRAA